MAMTARQRYIKWKKRFPSKEKSNNLNRCYGVTIQEYNKLVEEQKGLCAICQLPPKGNTPKTSVLHIDHDHETNEIRELLCWACNVGLGMLKDNPQLCDKAAAYLRRHHGNRRT